MIYSSFSYKPDHVPLELSRHSVVVVMITEISGKNTSFSVKNIQLLVV